MHKSEWHEFSETAGLLLDLAEHKQLVHPVFRCFHVTVHQRGSTASAAAMSRTNDLFPLFRRQLVARENEANVVVEDFRRCSGERIQAVVTEHAEIILERHASEFHTVRNLHGRKGVNVHAGNSVLNSSQNVSIVERRKSVRQSALDAYFGRAEFPCFDGFACHLLKAEKICVGLTRASAESTEFAAHKTDIRKINVAIYDVGDEISC